MRIVKTGTKDKPYLVQQKELDPNLCGSYFKHFRMEGLDLRGFALDNVDFLDGEVVNCDLTDASMNWMVSHRTKWTDSNLSRKLAGRHLVSCHDVIAELLRQGILRTTDPRLKWSHQLVIDYITSSYYTSWPDTAKVLVDAGLSIKEIIEGSEQAFGDFPGFIKPWRYLLNNENMRFDAPQIWPDKVFIDGAKSETEKEDFLSAIIKDTDDRWILSRRAEAEWDIRYPERAPWRVSFSQAEPSIISRATPDSQLSEPQRWIYALYGVLV